MRIISALSLSLLFFIAIGCQPDETQTAPETESAEPVDPLVQINEAQRFDMEYFETHKVITINNPWPDAEEDFTYVLYDRDEERPEGYEDAQFIEIPATDLVCLSSACISYAIELDLLDKLVGIAALEDVSNPEIRERVENGDIAEVGRNENVNVELMMEIDPTLVGTYGVGMSEYDSHPKLQEAGIPVAIHAQYMENTPLGRAEWIKFLAAFFDVEEEAEAFFANEAEQYNHYASLADNITDRPDILVGKNRSGTWWLSGGQSYLANLLEDAGGNYLWSDDDSDERRQVDFEYVYSEAREADFWVINVGSYESIDELRRSDERYEDFRAYQNGNVFGNIGGENPEVSEDFWETGVSNPHLILKDLISIFHPDLLPDHERVFYSIL